MPEENGRLEMKDCTSDTVQSEVEYNVHFDFQNIVSYSFHVFYLRKYFLFSDSLVLSILIW